MRLQLRAWLLILSSIGILGLASAPILPRAHAHALGISLSAYTSSPPSIDGIIGVSEWANAAKMDFTGVYGVIHGSIFVMNDGQNLYLAVRIGDSQLPGRALDLFFDNNHNGTYDVGEKDLTYYIGMTSFDRYVLASSPFSLTIQPDMNDGGTTDGSAVASNDGSYNYYEFSTPLCSADTRHDFCLHSGDTLGFDLIYQFFGDGGDQWPAPDVLPLNDASHWGDIKIAPAPQTISLTEYFRDPSGNPLQMDIHDDPSVNAVLSNGLVRSTIRGGIVAWTNLTNMGSSSLQSFRLNQTLPIDWTVHPGWLPSRGAIHVFFEYTNRTMVEITSNANITVSSSDPQTVQASVANIATTASHTGLGPLESILLSTTLDYGLKGTSQVFNSYPRNYTDTGSVSAWTQPSFTVGQASASGSAFFITYAKVLGDVNGDGVVNITDAGMMVYAYGSRPGDARWNPALDVFGHGIVDIQDVSYVFYYYGNHA